MRETHREISSTSMLEDCGDLQDRGSKSLSSYHVCYQKLSC